MTTSNPTTTADEQFAAFARWADERAARLGLARQPALNWDGELVAEYVADAVARGVRGDDMHEVLRSAALVQRAYALRHGGTQDADELGRNRRALDVALHNREGRTYDWALCGWFADAAQMMETMQAVGRAAERDGGGALQFLLMLKREWELLTGGAAAVPSEPCALSGPEAIRLAGYTAAWQQALAVTVARSLHVDAGMWQVWQDAVITVFLFAPRTGDPA